MKTQHKTPLNPVNHALLKLVLLSAVGFIGVAADAGPEQNSKPPTGTFKIPSVPKPGKPRKVLNLSDFFGPGKSYRRVPSSEKSFEFNGHQIKVMPVKPTSAN